MKNEIEGWGGLGAKAGRPMLDGVDYGQIAPVKMTLPEWPDGCDPETLRKRIYELTGCVDTAMALVTPPAA